jgi:hypothetical protein
MKKNRSLARRCSPGSIERLSLMIGADRFVWTDVIEMELMSIDVLSLCGTSSNGILLRLLLPSLIRFDIDMSKEWRMQYSKFVDRIWLCRIHEFNLLINNVRSMHVHRDYLHSYVSQFSSLLSHIHSIPYQLHAWLFFLFWILHRVLSFVCSVSFYSGYIYRYKCTNRYLFVCPKRSSAYL